MGQTWQAVTDALAAAIETQRYGPPGTELPTRAELAKDFDTSEGMMKRALRILEERSNVVSQGRGRRRLIARPGLKRRPSSNDIADALRGEIGAGSFGPPRTRMQTPHTSLAKRFGVSQATIQRVLETLGKEGWVKHQGHGKPILVGERTTHAIGQGKEAK